MSTAASAQPARSGRSTSGAPASTSISLAVLIGAVGGIIASVGIASTTYQHHGFFTPLYHIASLFIAPETMMTSAGQAMGGSSFLFSAEPAALGAVIHMMTGLMYGVVFAVLVSAARLRGAVVVGAGAVWGVVEFAVSTWVGLPIAANIFNSGDQITHMATMVGYLTFLLEHVLFGLALGLCVAAGVRRGNP